MNFKKYLVFCFITSIYSAEKVSLEEQNLINHVKLSISKAEQHDSKLSGGVIDVYGMTSLKVKCLLNNICSLRDSTYLEIGVHKGGTFTAALFNNKNSLIEATAIDNWSQFGGPAEEFKENCSKFISDIAFKVCNEDCFKINRENFLKYPIKIYFYDGDHTEEAQYQAFTYYDSLFADSFIAIVDDWNWSSVKIGTKKAFENLGYSVLYEQELPAKFNGDKDLWWHGIYIAVIRK